MHGQLKPICPVNFFEIEGIKIFFFETGFDYLSYLMDNVSIHLITDKIRSLAMFLYLHNFFSCFQLDALVSVVFEQNNDKYVVKSPRDIIKRIRISSIIISDI